MKTNHNKSDYRQLKNRLLFKTVLMGVSSFFIIVFTYSFLLSGRLANGIVAIFQFVFRMTYTDALNLYQQAIRNNIDTLFVLAILLVFFIIFAIYLNWFVKYFYAINRGIDALIEENSGEISLLPELSATEKKLNTVRKTLENRKVESQLAEQRKNDLIVYLAHDLKTPLTSVIGYLTLLRDEPQISEALSQKYLSISLDKAGQLEDLVNEFFEITRFNLSHIPLEQSCLNLTLMLEQILFEFQPMFAEKGLSASLNAPPECMIICDGNKMQRVFDNLLRNAVTYSFENSEITVTVKQTETECQICFVNQGNPILPDQLDRIFEQFYRLDSSRGRKNGNTGLGLAIAREIVKKHGGTITAACENNQITFALTLPAPVSSP